MNKLVPKLRFPTPLMPYQRFRFGDLVSIKSNKFNPVTESFLYPCIELEHISQGTGILLGSVASDKVASQKNKFGAGDILFSKLRPYLKKYAMPTFEGICSSEIWVMKPNSDLERSYLYQYIQTDKFIYEANKSSGSKMPRSDWGVVSELNFYCPPKSEQQKIANFLASVDTKISQLTEKHRLLKDYKKGVMQQIFSQQIHFKDNGGNAFPEWQVKTIGDVMTESRIKGSSGDVAKKLTVKIWGKGVIPKKDDSKGSENTQYYKRKAGQFIYGKLDFLNCAFAIIPDELDGYESTLDLPSLDVSSLVNKFFVLEVVKQKRFYKRFGEIADGSRKAKRINVGVFQEMPITLPSKAEQNKIMAFLDSLDKKTNAVNEQIEQTKLFKKGLLQQMFV
ncbi:restriction endonuclease subunit S [Pseudoalteromonas sp. Z9A6]|uniref:restriction endonuclease subunit S n=1 Tax=Pseudoalteromonas sp. Z9A6 TaxID=2686352 RepID=UPI0013FD43AA|nr:restriction endonuclease subunit S [Pseudoalteromonas sp. Z9A6]